MNTKTQCPVIDESFQHIVESSLDGFIAMDMNGRIIEINGSYCQMTGYLRDELLNLHLSDIVTLESPSDFEKHLKNIIAAKSLRFETKHRCKDGMEIDVEVCSSYSPLQGGCFISFVRNISAQKEIIHKTAHFRDLMNYVIKHCHSGVAMLDTKMRYLHVSQSFCDQFKIKERDIIGICHYDLFPELPDQCKEIHRRVLSGEIISSERDPFSRENGTVDWTRWECRPWYEANGAIGGLIIYTEVFNERKKAETSLQESERRWKYALEGTGDGLWDWNIETNKVYYSTQWKTILGYAEDEVGDNLYEWECRAHPEDKSKVYNLLGKHFRRETESYGCEHRMRCKDGTYKWFHGRGKVIEWNSNGEPSRVIGTLSDINDRKDTDEALRISEERYRSLVDMSPDAIIINLNDRIIFANPTAIRLFRAASAEEIVGKNPFDFIHPDYHDFAKERFNSLKLGKPVPLAEEKFLRVDGTVVDLEAASSLFETGTGTAIQIILRDITDRKQAEYNIRRAREDWEQTFHAVPELISIIDADNTIRRVNKTMAGRLGLKPQEIEGRKCHEVMHGTHCPPTECPHARMMQTGNGVTVQIEEKRLNAVLEVTVSPIQDADGLISSYVHVVRDVTARMRLETYHRMGQDILLALNENSDMMVTLSNIVSLVKSTTGVAAVGIRLQDGDDYPFFHQEGFTQDFLNKERSLLSRARDGGVCRNEDGSICLECTCGLVITGTIDIGNPLFTNGGSFWTNNSPQLLYLPAYEDPRNAPRNECIHQGFASVALIPIRARGEIVGLLQLNDYRQGCFMLEEIGALEGVAVNIGEALLRKQAEERLRHTQNLLTEGQKIAHLGSFEYIADTRQTAWSEEEFLIYGLPPDEPSPDYQTMLVQCIHPDDREQLHKTFTSAMQNGSIYDLEHRIVRPDGEVRWVYDRAHPHFDGKGKLVRYVGTTLDITDRKHAELRILKAKQDWELTFDAVPDLIAIIDTDHTILRTNRALAAHSGRDIHDLVGKKCQDIFGCKATSFDKCPLEKSKLYGSTHVIQIEEERWNGIFDVTLSPILNDAGRMVSGVLVARDITERKRAEKELLSSRQFLRRLADNLPGLVAYWTPDLQCAFANSKYEQWYGKTVEQMLKTSVREVMGEEIYSGSKRYIEGALLGEEQHFEREMVKATGEKINAWVQYIPDMAQGELKGIFVLASDITEVKLAQEETSKLERQLQQAQKMESIGRLAGGVAHDFNNKLMVILANAELVLMDPYHPKNMDVFLNEIIKAAYHSRDITAKLLTFSRQQPITPSIFNVNDLIEESRKTLNRLIGDDVSLYFNPYPKLWCIKIDPVQLDQIIMNMAVNARDAMPAGGTFTIETANVMADEMLNQSINAAPPGDYVRISFRDNGVGMDKQTISHIFEPFFTTKEAGKGTGLGLSIIFGIVRQNYGFIQVKSAPGCGTEFSVYFQRQDATADNRTEVSVAFTQGTETILLVEDEEPLRKITTRFLQKLGYSVYEADTPSKALAIVNDDSVTLDLVLTDMALPEMNGMILVKRIIEKRPHIKVIYMSGYASEYVDLDELKRDAFFLQKPFNLNRLSDTLKKIFDNKNKQQY